MNRSFKAVLSILSATLIVTGCTSQTPVRKPVRAPAADSAKIFRPEEVPVVRAHPAPRQHQSAGGYGAARVYGDYASYASLDSFIERMVTRHGFSREYLNGLFSQVHRKQWTLDYMSRQGGPTSAVPRPGAWTRYRSQFLTEQHISGGVDFWRRHAESLHQASERYGVPPEYIIGIMGVETIYGRNLGSHRVVDALTTLAFDYPRRGAYFEEELENFLLMSRDEGVDPTEPVGSFAGAMGLGQFMPGSFLKWAVDFDHDGRRDLWTEDDAVGSIANYFAQHGWRRGEPVVTRALVSDASVEALESGYDAQYSLDELERYGVQPAGYCPEGHRVSLLRLRAADRDEYWLGHQNFYVITRYNHSMHYAMAVHQLAQAVKARYAGS